MLTPEKLHELLEYDPETGTLTWRERPVEMFSTVGLWRSWNTRWAGSPAITATARGYKSGQIMRTNYYAHRVIWAMTHGEWPDQIDHINGIRGDNRIENLRSVTHLENGRNQKMRCTNTSGRIGVHWTKASGKWSAQIKIDGFQIHLGSFIDIEDAIAARAAAEIEHGFHENHGRVMP